MKKAHVEYPVFSQNLRISLAAFSASSDYRFTFDLVFPLCTLKMSQKSSFRQTLENDRRAAGATPPDVWYGMTRSAISRS